MSPPTRPGSQVMRRPITNSWPRNGPSRRNKSRQFRGGDTTMFANHLFKAGACAVIVAAAGFFGGYSSEAQTRGPRYEVDINWPKPLPNRWVLGGLGGLCVDRNDHVFILNRQDVLEGELNAGVHAPNIIEIDPAGNVVNSWGDAKLLDDRLHSCHVDQDNNIWIGSAPSGMVQKYSHDGKLLQ